MNPISSKIQKVVFLHAPLPYTPSFEDVIFVEGEHTFIVERWRIDFYRLQLEQILSVPSDSYAEKILAFLQRPDIWTFFNDEDRERTESSIIDLFDFRKYIDTGNQGEIPPSVFVFDGVEGEKYRCQQFVVGKDGLWNTLERARLHTNNKDYADACYYEQNNGDDYVSHLKTQIEELKSSLNTCKAKLKEFGMRDPDIEEMLSGIDNLPGLCIKNHKQIYLCDSTGNTECEVRMSPLDKAVFFLFLNHPEGINFSYLPDYRQELLSIYRSLMNCRTTAEIEGSVMDVTDPTKNSINEKCARIRRAFVSLLGQYKAENYCVIGPRGGIKVILLDRRLIRYC